jgi:hypothetical protein
MEEVITPIRVKSRRQVKRGAKVGATNYDSMYNLKVSKRRKTSINSHITFVPAR